MKTVLPEECDGDSPEDLVQEPSIDKPSTSTGFAMEISNTKIHQQ